MSASIDWRSLPQDPAFAPEEYGGRLAAVQRGMRERGLDALVVADFSDGCYLAGVDSIAQYDYQAVVVPVEGVPVVVLNEFHEGVYQHRAGLYPVRGFSEFDDPVARVADVLAGMGPMAVVGVDQTWPEHTARLRAMLEASSPGTRVVPGSEPVRLARAVKSPAELHRMRAVAAMTEAGAEAAGAVMAVGVSDREIAAAAMGAMLAAGSDTPPLGPIVCSGYRGGIPYSTFNGYRLQSGDPTFVELTATQRRYVAPLMRSSVLGAPSTAVELAARVTAEATRTILRTARAGAAARAVAEEAMGVLAEGLAGKAFHNIIGYPVGIAYPPSWVEPLGRTITVEAEFALEEGMVFHLPMSLRSPGEWAIGLSQTIVVGADGAAPLGTSVAELALR